MNSNPNKVNQYTDADPRQMLEEYLSMNKEIREHNEKYRDTKYVYLLKCEGFYKIGYAYSVNDRVASMQTGSPFEIKIVYAAPVKDWKTVETRLHERYNHKNIRGEWFELDEKEALDVENTIKREYRKL